MSPISEESVLLAIDIREDLFEALSAMLSSDNYLRVLMALEETKSQTEVAEAIGVGGSTVSRAVRELLENDLIEETENGYRKKLRVLDHPMIQYFYDKEVLGNE